MVAVYVYGRYRFAGIWCDVMLTRESRFFFFDLFTAQILSASSFLLRVVVERQISSRAVPGVNGERCKIRVRSNGGLFRGSLKKGGCRYKKATAKHSDPGDLCPPQIIKDVYIHLNRVLALVRRVCRIVSWKWLRMFCFVLFKLKRFRR